MLLLGCHLSAPEPIAQVESVQDNAKQCSTMLVPTATLVAISIERETPYFQCDQTLQLIESS